jgi:hypothetical protein
VLRGRRRSGPRRSPRPAALAHAERQLRGLERALRLERRRDYFRAAGRSAAAELVSGAIAELEAHQSTLAEEGAGRALGH